MAFQPISISPKDGTPLEVPLMATMRYLPYKSKFTAKYGLGRWQMLISDTWVNVPFEPTEWQPVRTRTSGVEIKK